MTNANTCAFPELEKPCGNCTLCRLREVTEERDALKSEFKKTDAGMATLIGESAGIELKLRQRITVLENNIVDMWHNETASSVEVLRNRLDMTEKEYAEWAATAKPKI